MPHYRLGHALRRTTIAVKARLHKLRHDKGSTPIVPETGSDLRPNVFKLKAATQRSGYQFGRYRLWGMVWVIGGDTQLTA